MELPISLGRVSKRLLSRRSPGPQQRSTVIGIVIADEHISLAWLKKGPGGEYQLLALTQSYALSHGSKIVQQAGSSAKIAIFLPKSMLNHLELTLPNPTPAQEIDHTLEFLIENQGYAPLTNYRWDAAPSECHDNEVRYRVELTESEGIDQLVQALGATAKQVQFIGASACNDSRTIGRSADDKGRTVPYGPWICAQSAEQALDGALWFATTGGKHDA